jgi:C-terminal processing protease CtpA/Prc
MNHNDGRGSNCEERLSYTQYGNTGYINACWFDVKSKGKYSLDSLKCKIDVIFKQIHEEGIQKLVIDVSQNGGGNSAVGEYLISSFYDKPYKDYMMDYKKSEEYLKLYESWGFHDDVYSTMPNGEIIHYPSKMTKPEKVPYRFNGKVIVVMGKPTFSSAMTFVTLIKDNNIAPLIGQSSLNGHPTGLGEQFYTSLPHTKIFVRLSVKEFIRPAGKGTVNNLQPDILLTDKQMNNIDDLLNF